MKYDFCGIPPTDFNYQPPSSDNFVFFADPNFVPINLKNFFGSVVTVNSYYECFYYGELGWSTSGLTIFDVSLYAFIFLFLMAFFYFLRKKQESFLTFNKKFKTLMKSKNSIKLFTTIYLLIQIRIIFEYVKNKAINLRPFIDEYVSLSSNYHIFKELDFSAGGFLGDTFSVYLTSGPISAIGSIFGWSLFKNIYISRISNYFWIVFLLFIYFFIIKNKYKLKQNYFIFFIFQLILLVPWWQGGIYSLGEIPSLIFVSMAMLTFQKNRKLSLILFGVSIFLGKFLNIIIFVTFYATTLIIDRSFKAVIKDVTIFVVALLPWFILINLTYQKGNIFTYFYDLYYFVTDSNASGVQIDSIFNFSALKISILNSEYSSWNVYEKIRIGILPLIALYLIIKNKIYINKIFGNISYPIVASILSIYLWFWILNPLKWMRYSQHFTVLSIILISSFVLFEVFSNKIDYFFSFGLLTFYLDNTKKYFIYYLLVFFLIYLVSQKNFSKPVLIILMSFLITFDISTSVFKQELQFIPDATIQDCEIKFNTDICRESYFDSLNE